MIAKETTPSAYLASLPPERRKVIAAVRAVVKKQLPKGYVETMNWGMLCYEIPLSRYPDTYNKQPLMYMALAAQKNKSALYMTCASGEKALMATLVAAQEVVVMGRTGSASQLAARGPLRYAWTFPLPTGGRPAAPREDFTMQDRRGFVASVLNAAIALPVMNSRAFRHLDRATLIAGKRPAASVASDEDYWGQVRRSFDLDDTVINLNNGGCSPAPTHVLDQMIRDLRFSNELPVEHMWGVLEPRIESVRTDLAREFGCDPEEMAITRNASEANENVIFGIDLEPGDEIISTTQNYPRMVNGWMQRQRRNKIVFKQIKLPTPPPSDDEVVAAFEAAITPRTKMIEVMHVSFMTGFIAPVRKIVNMARRHNVEVLVDGAHAFAHFPFTRDQLGCDYYGTSLHKWCAAPIGTGFLYVRKAKIPHIWGMFADSPDEDANIRKYEEIGTHPAANHNAVSVALAFHRSIGAERKYARLVYLRDRWAKRLLKESDRVHMFTPMEPGRGGAIGVVGVTGLDMGKLGGWLHERHHIVTTPMVTPEFAGLRVTPNVYTSLDEIDFFADRMVEAIKNGV